jgi:hypothetical protein
MKDNLERVKIVCKQSESGNPLWVSVNENAKKMFFFGLIEFNGAILICTVNVNKGPTHKHDFSLKFSQDTIRLS